MADASELVQRLFRGDPSALSECRSSAPVAREVSQLLSEQVLDGLAHGEHDWETLQHVVVDLAEVPGVDRRSLAKALLHAIASAGRGTREDSLRAEAFRLMLDEAPDEVEKALQTGRAALSGLRILLPMLWGIPGQEGAEWLRRLVVADDSAASLMYQGTMKGFEPWADADWSDRVDALASLPPDPRPRIVNVLPIRTPPREAARALSRLVCRHATGETDGLLRSVASQLGALRRASAVDDVDLIDWTLAGTDPGRLVWLLELMGPAGYRQELVAAARAADRIRDPSLLLVDRTRPAWADAAVPWQVDEVVEAGELWIVTGELRVGTAGAPGDELPGLSLAVPRGRYRVQVAVAAHPLHARENAAARVVLDEQRVPVRWSLQRWPFLRFDGETSMIEEYRSEIGIGSFGDTATYVNEITHLTNTINRLIGSHPGTGVDADGRFGSVVMFTIGPQEVPCKTWGGYDEEFRLVELVTDLGLLALDLEDDPDRNPFRTKTG